MEEIKQFKSLDDLKKVISDLEGFMARPVARGNHPTIYLDMADGQYRTVSEGFWGQVLNLEFPI